MRTLAAIKNRRVGQPQKQCARLKHGPTDVISKLEEHSSQRSAKTGKILARPHDNFPLASCRHVRCEEEAGEC